MLPDHPRYILNIPIKTSNKSQFKIANAACNLALSVILETTARIRNMRKTGALGAIVPLNIGLSRMAQSQVSDISVK